MSEISRCPFCGGEASVHRCEHAFHDAKIRCAGCQAEGPIFDVDDGEANEAGRNEAEAIAAWNRRTPAPEGKVVAWGCFDANDLDDKLVYRDRRRAEDAAFAFTPSLTVKPLYASPVVPVGSGEALRSGLEAAYKAPIGKRWWPELAEDRKAVARILNSPILMQTIADAILAALRPTDTGANHD